MNLHGEASGELVFVATVGGRHDRWWAGGAPNKVCAVKKGGGEVEVTVAEERDWDTGCDAYGVLDVEISLSSRVTLAAANSATVEQRTRPRQGPAG